MGLICTEGDEGARFLDDPESGEYALIEALAGAQTGREADDPYTETAQGDVAQVDAPRCGGHGEMAREGGQRMVELLRCPWQWPIPTTLHHPPEAAVANDTAPQVAEDPFPMGPRLATHHGLLAQAENPTPVARPTICRQRCHGRNPREEPRALAGMRGSARGALGNRRPYRNENGRVLKLLPLVHPRQAAGLGHHDPEWKALHEKGRPNGSCGAHVPLRTFPDRCVQAD